MYRNIVLPLAPEFSEKTRAHVEVPAETFDREIFGEWTCVAGIWSHKSVIPLR
jgi:hypothetical protein